MRAVLLPRSRATTVAALVAGVVLALLATLVTPTAATAAAAPSPRAAADDPRYDTPDYPAGCARPGSSTPQRPTGCRMTPFVTSRPTIILWGDSHAGQMIPSLVPAARKARVNVVSFIMGSCPPARVSIRPKGQNYAGLCEQSNAFALRYARTLARGPQPSSVVLGSNWSGFRDLYRKIYVDKTVPRSDYDAFINRMLRLSHRATGPLFDALGRSGVRVDVIDQAGTVPEDATCADGETPFVCTLPRSRMILHETQTRRWLTQRLRAVPGPHRLIDPNRGFCDNPTRTDPRTCTGLRDGIYTFTDDLHLSASRTRTLTAAFVPSLRALNRRR